VYSSVKNATQLSVIKNNGNITQTTYINDYKHVMPTSIGMWNVRRNHRLSIFRNEHVPTNPTGRGSNIA